MTLTYIQLQAITNAVRRNGNRVDNIADLAGLIQLTIQRLHVDTFFNKSLSLVARYIHRVELWYGIIRLKCFNTNNTTIIQKKKINCMLTVYILSTRSIISVHC